MESYKIPTTDPWSLNSNGFKWLNPAWLWDVIVWNIYQNFNYAGLVVFNSLLILILIDQTVRFIKDCGSSKLIAVVISSLTFISLFTYELPDSPLAIAPQLISILFVVILNRLIFNGLSCFLIPPLFIFWANLHGGFFAGIIPLLIKIKDDRKFFLITLLSLLAVCINPYGIDIYKSVFRSVGHSSNTYITEWNKFNPAQSILASILILLSLVSVFKTYKIKKLELINIQVIFWIFYGFLHQRHLGFGLLLGSIPTSYFLSSKFKIRGENKFINAAKVGLLACTMFFIFTKKDFYPDWPKELFPHKEIEYLNTNLPNARLFNDWNLGSFLILESKIPIFIDGRAGTAYPPEFFERYQQYIELKDWDNYFESYHIDTLIFPNYRTVALNLIKDSPNWKIQYQGEAATIFRKRIN